MEPVTVFAVVAAIFMGISIGASSVAPSFAPVNSSAGMNVMRLALLAGIFAFLGAVLQGQNVAETVGAGILFGSISTIQGASILFIGSSLVIISVLTDYPMPTAFTVVGSVIGSGFAFGNGFNLQEISMIIGFWALTPVVSLYTCETDKKIRPCRRFRKLHQLSAPNFWILCCVYSWSGFSRLSCRSVRFNFCKFLKSTFAWRFLNINRFVDYISAYYQRCFL